ncbi:MAG TPA: lanthionine synthetase LanC family protein [Gemmatimonadales bacterium]
MADAVKSLAAKKGVSAEELLVQAYPLLRDCFNSRFLVAHNSPEAARILPTCERGDTIGRFRILRCVHVLQDSELYQARAEDGTLVAVKMMRAGVPRRTAQLFTREVEVLTHLAGDGAPALLEQGRRRGRRWLALEWRGGISPDVAFAEFRNRDTHAAECQLLELALGLVRAYARLHDRGVLHGDVHPRNLLIGRGGETCILDFGIARALPPLRFRRGGGRGGVPRYFPPEYATAQLSGRDLPSPTRASEQAALGALLYELFCGRPYVDFELDRREMLGQIRDAPQMPFVSRQVPPWPELEAVLARMLAKRPRDRYPTLWDIVQAFERLLRAERMSTRSGAVRSPNLQQQNCTPLVDRFLARVGIGGSDFPGRARDSVIAPTASLMHGSAGVSYALYRMACHRDDASLLALADAWLCHTEKAMDSPDAFEAPGTSLSSDVLGPVSPFHAASGVHLTRALVSMATGDRRSSDQGIAQFERSCRTPWGNHDLTLGRAGILLGCATLLEALPGSATTSHNLLRGLGDETLHWLWSRMDRFAVIGSGGELENFGIAHGWAGLLYATLRYCTAAGIGHPSRLADRLDELAHCAEPSGRGVRWWQRREAGGPDGSGANDIPGWCNGSTGFIYLWTLAAQRLGSSRFLGLAESCAWSAWEAKGGGTTLCCGLAGQAYGLLHFYRQTGEAAWLTRARTLGARTADMMEHERYRPERPLGLFTGIPGVALLLIDLERPETAAMPFFESDSWPMASHGA